MLGRWDDCPIDPATHCIILKIVGFKMFVYLLAFLEHKHCWRVLNQNCKHFSIAICQNVTISSFARVKENRLCYWDILIDSSQAKLCKIHEDFKENLETMFLWYSEQKIAFKNPTTQYMQQSSCDQIKSELIAIQKIKNPSC